MTISEDLQVLCKLQQRWKKGDRSDNFIGAAFYTAAEEFNFQAVQEEIERLTELVGTLKVERMEHLGREAMERDGIEWVAEGGRVLRERADKAEAKIAALREENRALKAELALKDELAEWERRHIQ